MSDDEVICNSIGCDLFSLLITVTQLGQFIPQHVEMAVDKSVKGVSPWLLFFGGLYTHLAALDIMISSSNLFSCNKGYYRCFIDSQPIIQMIGSALFTSTMWYWYLKYESSDENEELMDDGERALENNFFYAGVSPQAFFLLFLGLATLSTVLGGVLVLASGGTSSTTAKDFAKFCGFSSAGLNAMYVGKLHR